MNEIWKPVVGFEGYYEVSDLGDVRSVTRIVNCSRGSSQRLWKGKKLRKTLGATRGYYQVTLSKKGILYKVYVHVLVAKTFLNGSGQTVNHKDGDKLNNRVDNLEYLSYSDNNKHAYLIGLKFPSGGRNVKN